jgi:hypothetical protein
MSGRRLGTTALGLLLIEGATRHTAKIDVWGRMGV